jgi:anionic cell wall polymer biosynthesis LytR-Cps2A-Psr (LCP) family protein
MYMKFINKILTKLNPPEKPKNKRRRSNWYIYLISFALTFTMLGLFVIASWGSLFAGDSGDRWDANYVPPAELDTTILFMLSDARAGVPHKFMLLSYRPREEIITIVPLSADTRLETRSGGGRIADLYQNGRAGLVIEGISRTLGVDCSFFVKFDRASFTTFTEPLGNIAVTVPFPFFEGGLNLVAGEHLLSGGDLFIFMTLADEVYADFAEAGSDPGLAVLARSMTALINSNMRNMDEESINGSFNRVMSNTNTNVVFTDFIDYQRALFFTSNTSITPAGFYLPTGTRVGNEFVISADSLTNIRERFRG